MLVVGLYCDSFLSQVFFVIGGSVFTGGTKWDQSTIGELTEWSLVNDQRVL